MFIDNTYSFFSGPEMEAFPPLPKTKKYVKRESTRMSQPNLVRYNPITQPHAELEDWVIDTSYGYFSCPSFHPEPVVKEIRHNVDNATPPPLPKQIETEGYSYFGI